MTIIAGQLIREAYKLASVLDQSEEPQGFYAIQGLNYLNDIITQWGAMGVYIPYENMLELTLQQNVSDYIVTPVIVQLLEANIMAPNSSINNATALSTLNIATPKERFLFNPNQSSRPGYIYLSGEQTIVDTNTGEVGSKLTFWPTPDATYIVTLLLKYQIQIVSLFQTLNQFPDYYLKPLKYQLAKDFSALYKTELPPSFFDEYERLMEELKATNPVDLTIQNTNPFLQRRPFRPLRYNVY